MIGRPIPVPGGLVGPSAALISSPGDPSWFVGEDRRDLTVVIEMSERLR